MEGNSDLGLSQTTLQGEARVLSYLPDEVLVHTRADRQALLVLADNHYTGWQVSVDGRRAPLHIANHTFRGVVVPSGEHEVRFEFRPLALWLGAGLSSGCLTLLASYGLWLLWPAWRRRRSTRQRQSVEAA